MLGLDEEAHGLAKILVRKKVMPGPEESEWTIVHSAVYSRDGSRILAASNGLYTLWDALSGILLRRTFLEKDHAGPVEAAEFSPDGTMLLVAYQPHHAARIWEVRTERELPTLQGHENIATFATFNSDGAKVATANRDRTTRVWEVDSGKVVLTLRGHRDEVTHCAFSPDGARLATASRDGTARLWDAQTGEEILVLDAHKGEVVFTTFSPDSSRCITTSEDGTARIWPVNLLAATRDSMPRQLTPDEVDRFEVGEPEERSSYRISP